MKKIILILSMFLIGNSQFVNAQAKNQKTAIAAKSFTGKFSSEGDVKAKGIFTMEIDQAKAKIEGVGRYVLNTDESDTGLLSVNGYVKNNIAYVRFRDQKGLVVADGTIKFTNNNTVAFQKTAGKGLLPTKAYLYK